MLIIKDNKLINFDRVNELYSTIEGEDYVIIFYFSIEDRTRFYFETEDKQKEAIEKILQAYINEYKVVRL